MTSHRTTTKILLTALLITLTTGTAAALEITTPSSGAANNTEFFINVSQSNYDGDYSNIGLRKESGGNIADPGELSSTGEFRWDVSSGTGVSEQVYSVQPYNSSTGESSEYIELVVDRSAGSVDSVAINTREDGSVEITVDSFSSNGPSSLEYFNITRTNQSGGVQYFKKDTVDNQPFVDDQTEFTTYDYSVRVIDAAGNVPSSGVTKQDVSIVDGLGPNVSVQSPSEGGYVNTDSPALDVDVSDDLAGVKNATLTLEGEEDNVTGLEGQLEASLELTVSGLEDGSYSPQVVAYDMENNKKSFSWEFTVDTQKPDPSASLTPNPDEQEYLTTETPIGVEVDSGDVSSIGVDRVECFVDSPNDYGYDFGESSTYEDGSFRCGNLNPADYSEGSHSIYVKFYDRAGNSEQRNLGDYVFDTQAPAISDLTITPEYTNVEPNVTVEGSDSGSGLQDAEYMFSDSVDEGEGSSVSASFEDGELVFQPNLRNKEDGDYELYVRVQDGSGKWSDLSSATFTLDRGALPQPDLQVDVLNITSGSETNFEVTVENNGKVPLMDATLEFSNGVEGSLDGVEVQGESSQTYSVPVSTDRSFGKLDATLTLTASTVSDNVTVPVNVMASEEQMNQVDSRIEEYNGRLSALKANLSRLEEEGASQQLLDDMRADIQTFESGLETIKASAVDNNYYEIASELEEVETQKSQAVNTTEEVKTQYRENQRQFWMIIFGLAFLGLAGGGVFVYLRSDYYIDMDDLPVNLDNVSFGDMDWDETVDKVEEKLDNLFGGEGDAEESPDSKDLSWD